MTLCALLFLSIVCLACAKEWRQLPSSQQHTYSFEHFKAEFGRNYPTQEETLRREIFEKRLASIIGMNLFLVLDLVFSAHNKGASSWKRGINKFADLTSEEFKARLGLKGLRSKDRFV